jgi:hypothetical protein
MTQNLEAVLVQNDCSPDSLEQFDLEFEKIVGQDFLEWKLSAQDISTDWTRCLMKNNYVVEKTPDYPYWTLYCARLTDESLIDETL